MLEARLFKNLVLVGKEKRERSALSSYKDKWIWGTKTGTPLTSFFYMIVFL